MTCTLARGLWNIWREVRAVLRRAKRGIIDDELVDCDTQIEAGAQRIARQVYRSGDAAARDDVVVTERGQGTCSIYQHEETRSGWKYIKALSDQRRWQEARRGYLSWWGCPNLPCHTPSEAGHEETYRQDAKRLGNDRPAAVRR